MKKALILVIFVTQINFAQSIFPTDGGNVGIGTTIPTQKLEVNGNVIFNGAITSSMSDYSGGGHLRLINPSKISNGIANTWMIYNMAADFGNSLQFWSYDKLGCAGGGMCENRFTIMDNGNIGIGTTNPEKKLQIDASSTNAGLRLHALAGNNNTNTPYLLLTGGYLPNNGVALRGVGDENYGRKAMVFYSGWEGNSDNPQIADLQERMRISSNGNVGIGIINPNNKLDVNGTIHSKEVKVDMSGWSDFVFKKEYTLPTLEEVEKHIAEKGHLENIPNEQEVLKNGINLGEMNAKLLQKIEELTLYMIEMKKENASIKRENDLMKKNQTKLQKRILNIENK